MTKKDLIDIIKNLKISSYLPNDIACRALKGKIEKELNVAIFKEIQSFINPPLSAVKGWKCSPPKSYAHLKTRCSIDAAVLKDNIVPVSLIEMKAHNSIDYPGWLIEAPHYHMLFDLLKLIENAHANTELYFIFFNNVLDLITPVPSNCKDQSDIRINYKRLLSSRHKCNLMPYNEKVLRVFKNWVYLLQHLGLSINLTTAVEINAGQCCNIPVSIIAFVYGPFSKDITDVLESKVRILHIGNPFHDPKFWEDPLDEKLLEGIKLDSIDFYYEDKVLENLGNGVNCIPITK